MIYICNYFSDCILAIFFTCFCFLVNTSLYVYAYVHMFVKWPREFFLMIGHCAIIVVVVYLFSDDVAQSESNIAVIVGPVVGFVVIVGVIAAVVLRRRHEPADLVYQGRAPSPASSFASFEGGAPGSVNPVYANDPLSCAGFSAEPPSVASADRPSYVAAVRDCNGSCNPDPA